MDIEEENSVEKETPDEKNNKKGERAWLAASIFAAVMFLLFVSAAFWVYYEMKARPAGYGLTAIEELSRRLYNRDDVPMVVEKDDLASRLIDGVKIKAGEDNLAVAAVVIDNHPDSRPSAGLAKAQLVYEAEAEGGLTRYLAFYAALDEVKEIGPVRSARGYFLDWAAEFGAVLSHCGGSPEALARLKQGEVADMNEFYQGGYFWRSGERTAPHNVMTSSGLLREYLEQSGRSEGDYFTWQFKTEAGASSTASSTLAIKKFGVKWLYDRGQNDYERELGGKEHKDADGTAIRAKNVVVMFTAMTVVDELLRLEIKTLGQGRALVCVDGDCQEGEWRKPSLTARTRFYNKAGNEFIFNAGTTWIEVVGLDADVTY